PGVITRANTLDSQMLSKGTNGEFGYLKSLDSDENEIWEVLGHVPGDSDDIFSVASFDMENDAKEFCNIVNELGIDRTQAMIQEQLTSQHDQATAQEHNTQEIYCINFSHLHDENEGVVFHSKDAAID
ncbi:hypothetical protein, partial [Salmonella enterica]|uniref:hypothetical protein n=1 Tax=Salmonella enterica TaxID=28901 RepID=UPI000C10B406